MAKSHKTKKHLKSEKAKTKLKTKDSKTKFLPKGGNITDVNFKIKPIVIREQLKLHGEDEVLSKRKLNIKDLLLRIRHYNINSKLDALQDFVDIFSSFSEPSISSVIQSYISQILQNVCHLVLDREKTVRRKAIQLLSLILSLVNKNKIVPFSAIILSHLKCAMTDIDKNVQADSLLLMDSLVTNLPQLITENASQILQVFFILISAVQAHSNQGKVLSLNLQGSTTSIKWRIQVLSRLQKILNIVVNKINEKNGSKPWTQRKYNGENSFYLPIYNDLWHEYPFGSANSFFTMENEEESSGDGISNYIKSLVPLLYDTWLESVPENKIQQENNEATALNQEAATILKGILIIFYFVWQLVNSSEKRSIQDMINLFSNKAGKKFFSCILIQFPYSQNQTISKEKGKEFKDYLQLNMDPKCVEINLLICYLFCKIHRKLVHKQQQKEAEKVLDYLKRCLFNRNFVKEEGLEYLISTIQILVFENCPFWTQKLNVVDIVVGLIHYYENTVLSEDKQAAIFNILCAVTQNSHLNSSEKFKKWLVNLPLMLCQGKVPIPVINTVSLLSRQGNGFLQEGLLKYLPNILENLAKTDTEYEDQEMYMMKIVSSYFYVPQYDDKNKKRLQEFINKYEDTLVGRLIKQVCNLFNDYFSNVKEFTLNEKERLE